MYNLICIDVRWYTPGHGDFYESFKNSGLLQKFIQWASCICIILYLFITLCLN